MTRKAGSSQMYERILKSALEEFSSKGFAAATMRDISQNAGCNTVTVFRHFDNKQNLFYRTVERYHRFIFDPEALNSRLSYINLRKDFRVMADFIFDLIYQNIHILRIFINDGHNFEAISKYLWFVPDALREFVDNYLQSMYMDRLNSHERSLIAEFFLCYIIRTCLRINVHEGIESNSRKIARDAKEVMEPSVDMTVHMIMLRIKKYDDSHSKGNL